MVKAVDIARELGISKATVSLALNNKPGVKEKTRNEILECKKRLEQAQTNSSVGNTFGLEQDVIKLVIMSREYKIVIDSEIDLWTEGYSVYTRIAKNWNCKLEMTYFDILHDDKETLSDLCNKSDVLGVIIEATEMCQEDLYLIENIKKPLVITDADLNADKYASVMMDNRSGVKQAMNCFFSHGKKNITYLAMDHDIYNFESRRDAFSDYMITHNMKIDEGINIVRMGTNINDIYNAFNQYLDRGRLPDAFFAESYHISIAAIRAFKNHGIEIGKDVGLIGFDDLPVYLTFGHELTSISTSHLRKAELTMEALRIEICNNDNPKYKIYTDCMLKNGDTE